MFGWLVLYDRLCLCVLDWSDNVVLMLVVI